MRILLTLLLLSSPLFADGPTRAKGVGMANQAHGFVGFVTGNNPTDESVSGFFGEFQLSLLGLPSQYGNYHGIEMTGGLSKLEKWDMWVTIGTPVTFLNIGKGDTPGSIRLGGSFGAGIGFRRAYAYLRARAAFTINKKINVEASYRWDPASASIGITRDEGTEETRIRVSVFAVLGGKSWEGFVMKWDQDLEGDEFGAAETYIIGAGMAF